MKIKPLIRPVLLAVAFGLIPNAHAEKDILNASYDISRELFEKINPTFVSHWKKKTGEDVVIKQSHAGTSRQARSILEGLQADVVTFNQTVDIDVLAQGGLLPRNWNTLFPHQSSPYYSLTSFLVRKGNPKGIKDWDDLAKPGVKLVFPNAKTSGNGRYTTLAAYAYARQKFGNDEAKSREFLKKILANVVVFDTGGRGSTTTFTERGIGDVLITFEAETYAVRDNPISGQYEVVTPSISIYAEFPVAVVKKVSDRRDTGKLANGYLEFLYTPEAQTILAENYYRIRDEAVAKKFAGKLASVQLVKVDEAFGGWEKVTKDFFDNNALVDVLLKEIAVER
jgi:sulfate transport system substrate-binding protein